jgi:hypothetical protein
MASVLVLAVFLARLACAQTPQSGQEQKISEGKYARLKDNLRVAGSEQSWILWRRSGGYEVEDHFQSQGDPADQLLSQLRGSKLSPELRKELESSATGTDIVVHYSLNWEPQTLTVQGKKLLDGSAVEMVKCVVDAKDVRCRGRDQRAKLHIQESDEFFYAFPFPMLLSAWFTRSAAATTETSPKKLAVLDALVESGNKLDLARAERNIQIAGDETLTIGDHQFLAHKAKITLTYHERRPLQLTVWFGQPGIVYALEGGGPSGERMALVEYKKYSDF